MHWIVWLIAAGIEDHIPAVAAKLNELCVDGEPHKPLGLSSAANAVSARDELAKGQPRLLGMSSHGSMITRKTGAAPWGVHPSGDSARGTGTSDFSHLQRAGMGSVRGVCVVGSAVNRHIYETPHHFPRQRRSWTAQEHAAKGRHPVRREKRAPRPDDSLRAFPRRTLGGERMRIIKRRLISWPTGNSRPGRPGPPGSVPAAASCGKDNSASAGSAAPSGLRTRNAAHRGRIMAITSMEHPTNDHEVSTQQSGGAAGGDLRLATVRKPRRARWENAGDSCLSGNSPRAWRLHSQIPRVTGSPTATQTTLPILRESTLTDPFVVIPGCGRHRGGLRS